MYFLEFIFSYLNYVVVFVALAIGAYTDLKTREISNYLSFGLMGFGILFWIAKSIYVGKFLFWPFIIGFGTFFVCYLLWYFSVFAGGDAKIISGVAFSIPLQDFSVFFSSGINYYFILAFFILSVFIIFPLGFFLAIKRIIANQYYKIIFQELVKKLPSYFFVAITLVGLYFIFGLLGIPTIFALLSFLLFKITWKILLPISLIVFAITLYLNPLNIFTAIVYVLISVIFFSFVKLFSFVRSRGFANAKKISGLIEGEILYESIYIKDNKQVYKPKIKDIFKYFKNKDILQSKLDLMKDKNYDYVILARPGGLYPEDITLLKKLHKEKIIPNEIYVKQSVPLTPALFLSYVLLLLVGGLI